MSNLKIKPFSDVTEFHGHICPGSALGYKASEIAIKELKSESSKDEELVCITENDTCAVDAIQVVTGCTFGKGNLIFHDYGKQVYNFINRESGKGVRISMKDSFSIDNIAPDLGKRREKVNSGKADADEEIELKNTIKRVSEEIIDLPGKDIFDVEHVKIEIPPKAMIFKSHKCSECGEMVSDHRKRLRDKNIFCIPCFNKKENE